MKKEKKQERIFARMMAKSLSPAQLKAVSGGQHIAGTTSICNWQEHTMFDDCDPDE